MKTSIFIFLILVFMVNSCSTEPDNQYDHFLIKIDRVELEKTVTLGDTLRIAFYGTIGGYSFDRFESTVNRNSLELKAWGKYKTDGAQADVMVYLDGREFDFVPDTKGDYTIIAHQPDGTTIEETINIQ